MTKVLLIGGCDYTALEFERSEYTPEKIVELLETMSRDELEDMLTEELKQDTFLRIYEFDTKPDEKFVKFVRDEIQDYDMSKAQNFYIL